VADGLYSETNTLALQHFYFQRCRTPLVAPYAVFESDSYLRETACHQHEEIAWDLTEHPEKKTRWKPERGWHDAGNFEMYVPSTAPTAQALLMAYESRPELFSDSQLNIPEAGNRIPDLLDEARWGLDWVLSMQDASGGFRNREAVMKWSKHMSADADRAPRWISAVGTASTAKGVSALALAARIYREWDADFAARCEAAARRGWAFLEAQAWVTARRIRTKENRSEAPCFAIAPTDSRRSH
jgi:endoglucanase